MSGRMWDGLLHVGARSQQHESRRPRRHYAQSKDADIVNAIEFKARDQVGVGEEAASGDKLPSSSSSVTSSTIFGAKSQDFSDYEVPASEQDETGDEADRRLVVPLVDGARVHSNDSSLSPEGPSTTDWLLANSFLSHIDKQWKFAEIILIIAISAILNLVTIVGNIMVLISFKMDRS